MQIGKKSVLEKIVKAQLLEFDCQKELYEIDNLLLSIFARINKAMMPGGNIEMQYAQEELLSILAKATVKTHDGRDIHELSEYDLVNEVIDIISNYQDKLPEKRLYVFENIDHLLTVEQYRAMVERCEKLAKESSAYYIFTTSMQRYLYYSEEALENVSIINDDIFSLDGVEYLRKFIIDNYPAFDNSLGIELSEFLYDIIQFIGMKNATIPFESQIILKMLNESIGIKNKWQGIPKKPELEFMLS